MKIAGIYLNQKNKRIDKIYDYLVPIELENKLEIGMRVIVSFGNGNRELEGFVVRINQSETIKRKLKKIKYLIDTEAILNEKQIDFCLWMKNYYTNLFYENLAYFLSPIPVIKERFIKPQIIEDNIETRLIFQSYFSEKKWINYNNIRKEDHKTISKMIEDGQLIEKKSYRVYKPSEEKFYYLKDNSINKNLGLIQTKIISLLQTKVLKESTLKQLIPQYKKSIQSLMNKGIIGEDLVSNFNYFNNYITSNQILKREIVLSKGEGLKYDDYQKTKIDACFFHANDQVSKYRIIFKLIEDQIKNDKSVLFLFPDINLSYQRLELFVKYFGDTLEFYHHNLKVGERRNIYQAVKNNRTKLIIGVQGALFLPFVDLGLIIVDEEHSQSYHSIGSSKFHIPDLVENYCRILKRPYILMDTIPSIKTWQKVSEGKINYLEIGKPKPIEKIEIIDMQKEMLMGNFKMISHTLYDEIKENLKNHKLSVLLINRTGYSKSILCRACGQVLKCPDCQLALKYDSQTNSLNCNYCNYQKIMIQTCPNCGKKQLRHLGIGIEQFQKLLNESFSNQRIVSVQGGLSLNNIRQINDDLRNNRIDILIGTQVLNKQFSFHNIGLAASLLIDQDLNLGEFDSAETTYQIYTRFFRKALKQGVKGYIQTNEPQNDTLLAIIENDFRAYYRDEVKFREILKYPPFYNLIEFKIINSDYDLASNDSLRLYLLIKDYCKIQRENYYLYKPNDQAYRSGNKWIKQIIFKVYQIKFFQNMMGYLIETGDLEKIKSRISIKIK